MAVKERDAPACCSCFRCSCGKEEDKTGFIPPEQRRCTDVLCLGLFVIFMVAFIAVGVIGLVMGEPWSLVYGQDYQGDTCGISSSVESRTLTAYPRVNEDLVYNAQQSDPTKYRFYGVCTSDCPSRGDFVCNYDVDRDVYTDEELLNCMNEENPTPGAGVDCDFAQDNCWYQTLDTYEVLYRCIPMYNVTTETDARCTFPSYITDPNDPRCVMAEEKTDTTTERPAQENLLFEQLSSYVAVFGRSFADIQQSALVIVLCAGALSIVASFLMFKAIEWFTCIMVWTIVVLAMVCNIIFTLYCYVKAGLIDAEAVVSFAETAFQAEGTVEVPQELGADDEYAHWYEYTAYVWTVVTLLLLCVLIAVRNEIRRSINIITLGSRALQSMPLMVFYPFASTAVLVGFMAYWLYAAAGIGTAGEVSVEDIVGAVSESQVAASFPGLNASEIYAQFSHSNATAAGYEYMASSEYLLMFHLLGGLWVMNFIEGIGIMVIGGASAAWYFSLDGRENHPVYGAALKEWKRDNGWTGKNGAATSTNPALAGAGGAGAVAAGAGEGDDVPAVLNGEAVPRLRLYRRSGPGGSGEVCSALCITCKKHLGTVAYGSLLIAIVQFVRAIFAYMEKQMSQYENSTMRYLRACIHYCLWLLEQCIKFVTRNAYLYTAIKGYSFCKSARSVFLLVLSKAKLLVAVNLITTFLVFLGKVTVSVACAMVAFNVLDTWSEFQEGGSNEIESPLLPTLVVLLFAFFISSAFFGVLDLSVDAILISYVLDMDESKQQNPGLREETPLHFLPGKTRGACCCGGTRSADAELQAASKAYNKTDGAAANVERTVSPAVAEVPAAGAAAGPGDAAQAWNQ